MHEVGAGWLMTSLSSSPSMVALVEAADSLPVMLLALPAGAIADIVDRRRLLISVQGSRLAEWVVSRIGGEYDLAHAWACAGVVAGAWSVAARSFGAVN
jgi:MFS family permease